MKKRLLFACASFVLLFASLHSQAQIQKGNILVGADIADFEFSLDEGGNFSFTIDPKAAWFVQDNTAIGAYLRFGLSTAKDAGTSINYGVGALGRYYAGSATNLVQSSRFFGEGTVGIEGDNPATGDNTNGLGIGFGPGWSFFVTPNIAFEALFKYNLIIGFGSAVTSNNLNLNIGFQIFLPTSKVKAISKDIQNQ